MEESRYSSKTLDHLGLIAGLMKEIGVSEVIDSCYGEQSPDQIVSNGKALEAMILNGLGFVNKRLYLIPKFFEDKPISRLLGDGFEAGHFNDDRLGRALDAFYASGVTALFAKLSRRTFEVLGHKPTQGHLDTTTLSAYGEYNSASEEPVELHITQGYSKDHRPDLAQATLQLICDNLSGIPIYMEALDGNSNDSVSFREAIEKFGQQLQAVDGLRTIVADSKLYSSATIQALKESGLNWVCRVPGSIEGLKKLLAKVEPGMLTALPSEGYSSKCYTYTYGGVDQHWVVYHSEKAAEREAATLERQLKKEYGAAQKSLKKLQKDIFHCREDALNAVEKWNEGFKSVRLKDPVVHKHTEFEKPADGSGELKPILTYSLSGNLQHDEQAFARAVFRRSLFVLATNEEVATLEEEESLLNTYKAQHTVERGFRFIKDPAVVASSFYVKKPERVEALLFVMASCLLIYTALEHRIRQALQKQDKTIPDQKGKPTKNPTARWVFQLFVGIHVLELPNGKQMTLNLKQEHRDILSLLSYWNVYS